MAKEVLAGQWGNGPERRAKLTAAGYDYMAVQSIVNMLVRDKAPAPVENVVETVETVEAARFNLLDVELDLSQYDGIHITITGREEE